MNNVTSYGHAVVTVGPAALHCLVLPALPTSRIGGTHFSSTTTLAPLAAIWQAVVSPPMPDPTMTASYSMSVGAPREEAAGCCWAGGAAAEAADGRAPRRVEQR